MTTNYSHVLLTVIALLLCAIVAKLYLPAAQAVGPQLGAPTLGDMAAASNVTDPLLRRQRQDEVRSRMPLSVVRGGVDVNNTVQVEGEVSINE